MGDDMKRSGHVPKDLMANVVAGCVSVILSVTYLPSSPLPTCEVACIASSALGTS